MHPLMMEILPWIRQGYCCSQLLILLALRLRNEENPSLVRVANGFCHGIGQSSGPCGMLTGGACVLALYTGRGAETEQANPYFTPLLNEYAEWFYARTEAYGSCKCSDVAAGLARDAGEAGGDSSGPDNKPNPMLCGGLLAECWEKLVDLCADYDVDMTAS